MFITNMKDELAYIFNGKQFIYVRKNKNKLNKKYVIRLEGF